MYINKTIIEYEGENIEVFDDISDEAVERIFDDEYFTDTLDLTDTIKEINKLEVNTNE